MGSGDGSVTPGGAVSGPANPPDEDVRLVVASMLGALLVVVGTFLPWLRSGEVWRNSYAVWRSADRLGVVSGLPLEIVHLLWFLLPLGAGLLLLTLALGRPRLATVVAVPLAALPAVGGLLVLRGPLPAGVGVGVTILGALIVGAATMLDVRRRRRVPAPP